MERAIWIDARDRGVSLPPLRIQFDGSHRKGRALGVVLEDFHYTIGQVQDFVPAGFQTDFESIPWFAQWLLPRAGRVVRSAIIHDEAVAAGGFSHAANRLMMEAMKLEGLTDGRRYLIGCSLWLYTSIRTRTVR